MKFFVYIFLLILLASCGQEQKNDTSPKEKFDAIEKIVGNENWRLTNVNDTSYTYFSRVGDTKINIYSFTMERGDSANTNLAVIVAGRDNQIYWQTDSSNIVMVLELVNDSLINWKIGNLNSKRSQYMKKIDSSHITYLLPEGIPSTMQKTLPLATFLVRSRYDYEHGTRYVDSPLVQPRKGVVVK